MKGIDIKQIRMRSFQISGLTAKWGIGGGRSPIWDNNLIGRWDARRGAAFTQMGFRQLLIFNKELSQAEVNDVLRVMFPA